MTWIAWFILVFVFIILEMAAAGTFYFLCFATGCLLAGIFACFDIANPIQYGIFAIVSLISVFTIRPLFKKIMGKKASIDTNVDALIGKTAIVTEPISELKCGFVKIDGDIWLAQALVEIGAGEKVIIESISGAKLKVKKEA
ncbi:MAG: NfeD family protein [Elusimicrobiota bacterium]|jgi:membrane protein implicated in regulation of membrane protease activity|nr:NfeD family protein [Elusimicrobiota bacterium]